MFVEKILRLNNSLALNDFASTLICGKDENDKPIFCDYFQVIKVYDDFAILFGSSSTTPHSEYLCTDFAVKDNNNLACEKTIEKVTEQWTDFLFMTFGENYSTAYLNNKISDNNQFNI